MDNTGSSNWMPFPNATPLPFYPTAPIQLVAQRQTTVEDVARCALRVAEVADQLGKPDIADEMMAIAAAATRWLGTCHLPAAQQK